MQRTYFRWVLPCILFCINQLSMFLFSESGHKHILAFKVLLTCVIQNIICNPFWKKDKCMSNWEQYMLLLRENRAPWTFWKRWLETDVELKTTLLCSRGWCMPQKDFSMLSLNATYLVTCEGKKKKQGPGRGSSWCCQGPGGNRKIGDMWMFKAAQGSRDLNSQQDNRGYELCTAACGWRESIQRKKMMCMSHGYSWDKNTPVFCACICGNNLEW